MRRATIHLELVTHCFLGSAKQTQVAEWRAQSIRGQLRWWFRAVAGGAFAGDLKETKRAEAAVFGSTGQKSLVRVVVRAPVGRGRESGRLGFGDRLSAEDLAERWGLKKSDPAYADTVERLRVKNPKNPRKTVDTNPIEYLAFGPIVKGELVRPFLPPGQELSFELVWRPKEWDRLADVHRRCFRWALWSWLHLGSIGARSRKGFGSLRCTGVEGQLPPAGNDLPELSDLTLEQFETGAAALLEAAGKAQPGSWTYLSKRSRVLVSTARFLRWEAAMEAIGAWLLVYRRRYGSPSDTRILDGLSLADRDYVWAEEAHDPSTQPGGIPDKAGFGLPLPFDRQGSAVTWVDTSAGSRDSKKDKRRASPLLVRIARYGDADFRPVLVHLPADLLPGAGELRYRYHDGRKYVPRNSPSSPPTREQLSVVDRFLDQLEAPGRTLVRRIAP